MKPCLMRLFGINTRKITAVCKDISNCPNSMVCFKTAECEEGKHMCYIQRWLIDSDNVTCMSESIEFVDLDEINL